MPVSLVFIDRTFGCPLSTLARRVLNDHGVAFTEKFYDTDPAVKAQLIEWTGFLSIPTLYVVADDGGNPITPPEYLEAGASPRGIDRGSMLTEPNADQLLGWLKKHGLVAADDAV